MGLFRLSFLTWGFLRQTLVRQGLLHQSLDLGPHHSPAHRKDGKAQNSSRRQGRGDPQKHLQAQGHLPFGGLGRDWLPAVLGPGILRGLGILPGVLLMPPLGLSGPGGGISPLRLAAPLRSLPTCGSLSTCGSLPGIGRLLGIRDGRLHRLGGHSLRGLASLLGNGLCLDCALFLGSGVCLDCALFLGSSVCLSCTLFLGNGVCLGCASLLGNGVCLGCAFLLGSGILFGKVIPLVVRHLPHSFRAPAFLGGSPSFPSSA